MRLAIQVIHIVEDALIWGVFYTLILCIGFGVPLKVIAETCFQGSEPLNYYCIFLIVSWIVLPFIIWSTLRSWISFKKSDLFSYPAAVAWNSFLAGPPKQPFAFLPSLKYIPEWKKISPSIRVSCIIGLVGGIIQTVFWWVCLMWGMYGITKTDNGIFPYVAGVSDNQLKRIIIGSIIAYAIWVMLWLISLAITREDFPPIDE